MPIYNLNNRVYDIPDDMVKEFENENPTATLAYQDGEDIYDIQVNQRDEFLKQFPKAKLYVEQPTEEDPFETNQKRFQAGEPIQRVSVQSVVDANPELNLQDDTQGFNQEVPQSEIERLKQIRDKAQFDIDTSSFFDRFFDADTRAAVAARNQAEEALETYEEANREKETWFDRNVVGVVNGIVDKATDLSTWDFGASGVASAKALNDAYNKFKNGEKLSAAEQNMLDAYGLASAVQSAYQDKVGMAYRVGGSLPESAGFMASLALNPLGGVGKKIAETAAKAAVKKYGTSLVSKLAKGAARVGGDVVEMAAATAIPGAGRVAEDYYNRLNGQSTFDIDNNGIIRYGGQMEQEEADDAIWKAFGSQFIENYSEAMGNYFAPMGTMLSNLTSKGLKAAHLGKFADLVNDISSSQFSRGIQRFKDATKFDGLIGEYLEEVAGNIMNAATVGDMNFNSPDDPRSVFNPETNVETFLSCSLMSGTMYAVEAPFSIYNRHKAKTNLAKADKAAESLWGERWADMREQMDNADPMKLANLLEATKNATDLDDRQKEAAFEYGRRLMQWQGYNSRSLLNQKESTDEANEIKSAYESGTELETPYDKHNAKLAVDRAESALSNDAELSTIVTAGVDSPVETIRLLAENGYSDEQIQKAKDYYTAYHRMNGLTDALLENVDSQIESANNEVDANTNFNEDTKESTIVPVTLRDGRQGYVISGTIVPGERGGIDIGNSDSYIVVRVDGKNLPMNPNKDLVSVGQITTPEALKEYNSTELKRKLIDNAIGEIDWNPATPNPKVGDSFEMNGAPVVVAGMNENGLVVVSAEEWQKAQGKKDYAFQTQSVVPVSAYKDWASAQLDAQEETAEKEMPTATDRTTDIGDTKLQNDTAPLQTDGISSENKDKSNNVQSQENQGDFVSMGKEKAFKVLGGMYGEKMPHKIEVTSKAWAEKMKKAQQKVDEAQQKLDDAPIGEDAKPKAAVDKAMKELESVKKEADFWAEMDADVKKAQEQRESIVNPQIEAETSNEPMTADEFVAQQLANGNIVLSKEDYMRETGFGNREANDMNGGANKLLTSNGMTLAEAGDRLMEMDRENGTNFFDQTDSNAGRDALISVLGSVKSRKDLNQYIAENRKSQAKRDSEGARSELESMIMSAYHMTLEEYATLEETILQNNPYEGVDLAQIDAIFAEAELERQQLNKEQYESGTITEGNQGQSELLPEERIDNSTGNQPSQAVGKTEGTGRNIEVEGRTSQESSSGNEVVSQIEQARAEVDANPTEAQKEAGNYKKGHVKIDGYDITIENPKGGVRSGTDKNGKKWSITMNNDYGYIRGTEAVDGDHIDVFLSDNPTEGNVFVVDQSNEDGSFDESKVMYGFSSLEEARAAYLSNYEKGWESRIMAITEVSKDEFKKWIDSSHRKTKAFSEYKSVKAEASQGYSIEASNVSRMEDIEARITEIENERIEIEGELENLGNSNPLASAELISQLDQLDREQSELEAEYSGLRSMNDESNAILEEEGSNLRFRGQQAKEEKRRKPLRERAKEWSKKLGVKVKIMESLKDVTNASARRAIIMGEMVTGWYEESTGEVCLYMPYLSSESEVDATYIHEVVAHKGLRGLLGDKFDEFCDEVWNMMSASDKAKFIKYPGVNGNTRAAADEYIAHLAENIDVTESAWGKFAELIKKFLKAIGLEPKMTNADIANAIKRSYQRLAESGNADKERIQNLINQQRTNLADVDYLDLDSIANIINSFENPTLPEEKTLFRTVYHGSAASFDKFDHSFMSTGEGNQSYGWGTYLTDVESIGKQYANMYAKNSPLAANALRWIEENGSYDDFLAQGEGKRRNWAIRHAKDFLKDLKKEGASEDVIKAYEQDLVDAENALSEESYNRTKVNMIASLNRNLYTVDIPENDGTNYLEWDKPLSEENKKRIKDTVLNSQMYKDYAAKYGDDVSLERLNSWLNAFDAGRVYRLLENFADNEDGTESAKQISMLLSDAGYTGFEYPSNFMSGGNENGSKNYVIFNEDDLKIVEHTRFRAVTDKKLIDKLESEPKMKVYRAMQLIDGKLYPPMSAKVDGKMREPIELGKWEEAEERPDLADSKGYFKLDKGNKTSLKARYNPYIHTSTTPLNDQFSSAQDRPELVTVEVEIPESELTSGYKAEKAKDAVGKLEWKAGVVQGKLSGTRTVILSRWDKPIRIVPDSEVADEIVKMFDDKQITMPSNVVTPSLRAELEKRGVPFVETDNQGKEISATLFRVKDKNELVAVHNISEENLRKVLNVGGLIMPSIAITKADMGHEGYGDISLLFDKETINPSDRRNKVYGGDAWTPRFPQATAKINDKVSSKVYKKINGLIDNRALKDLYSLSAELHGDNIERTISDRGVEGYYNKEWMKLAYLLDNGKKVKVPMKMKDYGDMSETIIAMAKERGLKVSDIQQGGFDFYDNNKDFVEAIKNIVYERKLSSLPEDKRDVARKLFGEKEMRFASFDTLISAATRMEYDLEHGGLKQIIDKTALRETIEKKVKTNNADYNKWVDNLFDGIVEKYGIRNDRDWYIPSGNLRPWGQLYDDATPANILKHMLAENEQGGSGGFFDSNIMGASAETYDSIEEIREKGKKRLRKLEDGEYDEWSNSVAERMSEICNEFLSPSQRKEFGAAIDSKIAITNAVAKDKTAKGIYKEMKRDYPGFTMEHAKKVEEIVKEIQDFAIGYFEAKPRRIVSLNEVRKAIVPKNTSKDVLDGLKDNGIEVATYKKGDEAARARLIKKESDGIRFRIANQNQVQDEVDKFTSKYKSAPVNVLDSTTTDEQVSEWLGVKDATTEELIDWMEDKKVPAVHVRTNNNIIIFAEKIKAEKVKETLFHENLHTLLNDGAHKELVDKFYKVAKDDARFGKWKKMSDKEQYDDYERPEEFFVYVVSNGQVSDNLEDVFEYLTSKERNELKELLNINGYDYDNRRHNEDFREENKRGSERENIESDLRGRGVESQEKGQGRNQEQAERIKNLFDKVADMGLDGVLGNETYKSTMIKMYGALPEESRKEVMDDAVSNYKGDYVPAMHDYLIKAKANIVDKVLGAIRSALRKAGFDVDINSSDVKYLLWRSKKPLDNRNVFDVAEDISKQYEFGVNGTRFSIKDFDPSDKRDALVKEYDAYLKTGKFNFIEAFQDRMYSLKVLMDKIVEATGKKVRDYEDAYTAENQLGSINKPMQEKYLDKFYKPLLEEIKKLSDKYGREVVERYIYCKSGLERNEVLRQRDADEAYNDAKAELDEKLAKNEINQAQYNTLLAQIDAQRQKTLSEDVDYSGIRGMLYNVKAQAINADYENGKIDKSTRDQHLAKLEANRKDEVKDWKDFAEKQVAALEGKASTKELDTLWNKINAATNETLRMDYESGMIDKETYDAEKNMMKYYVPLRNWDDTTAEEMYEYRSELVRPVSSNQKRAKGRESQADNPIATIGLMAQNAIVRGNKNKVNQKFYAFVANRETSLATVRDVWYVKDAQGNWVAEYADTSSAKNSAEFEAIIDQFEEDMKLLEAQGKAFKGKLPMGMKFKASSRQKQSHVVPVMINGKEYAVYVNGNPRAAQAMNGETNSEAANEKWEWYDKIKRMYSAGLTSWNPDFIIPNMIRDGIHASTMTLLDAGPIAAAKFALNGPRAFAQVFAMISGKGKSLVNPKYQAYFEEFIANGGETGYTAINTLEDYKKEYDKLINKAKGVKASNWAKDGFSAIGGLIETANRIFEDVNRFNAYVSARESGESIMRSVNAAKNITVNFNRKGAGFANNSVWGTVAGWMSKWILFFNPAVQSIEQFVTKSKANPKRATALGATILSSGFVMPMINELLVAALGGDDEDDYWNQSDYKRRNNWMLYTGDGYVTIPLPPVLRELYGIGDVIYGSITGHITPERAVMDVARQAQSAVGFFNLIPEASQEPDMITYAKGFAPDLAAPFLDVLTNTNFMGRPIAKWTDYNKYDPEYERVYKGTSKQWIEVSKFLNELGGNEGRRSDVWGNFINPAMMEHLITSYGGGIGKTINNLAGMAIDVAEGDTENLDPFRKSPIVPRFFTPVDEKSAVPGINRRYYDYDYRYNVAKKALKNYQEGVASKEHPEYQKYIDEMKENGEIRFMNYFKSMSKQIKDVQNRIKENPKNKKELEEKLIEMKAQVSVKCAEILK